MKNKLSSVYVERWDSPLRYRVRSRSRKHIVYIVDLGTWECQCEDFSCRHLKAYRETGDRLQNCCWHIMAALRFFWRVEAMPRLRQIPVVRQMPSKWLDLNKDSLALAFIDEIKHLDEEKE